jgi:DNA-binding NtrC family response regulator
MSEHFRRSMEPGMPRVLIVDYDPSVRDVLAAALEMDTTCQVETASSVSEAMAAARRERPDAAIIDPSMPKISGVELARQLLELGIPSLIMSGDPSWQKKLTDADCDFLAKPFHMDRFVTEMQTLVAESEPQIERLKRCLEHLARNMAALTKLGPESRELVEESRAARERRQHRSRDKGK